MSNTKVVGRNFNPSLVGLQITDINDKSLLTYTNFKLNASFKNRTVIDYNQFFSTTSNNNTLNTDIPLDKKIEFKNDNSNLLIFNNYGSTLELFRSTVDKILLNYPASLYCSNFFENKLVNNKMLLSFGLR